LIEHYTRVLETERDDGWNWLWRGMASHLANEFENALADYDQALGRGVGDGIVGFYQGDALDRTGKFELATSRYETAAQASDFFRFAPMPLIKYSQAQVNEQFWTPQSAAAHRLGWQPSVGSEGEIKRHDNPKVVGDEMFFSTFDESLQPRLRRFFEE
jgi:tetratricopeptide (TPR) repeat protein